MLVHVERTCYTVKPYAPLPGLCCVVCSVPLDEMVDQIFDSLLHLRFLQWDGVTLIRDLHNELSQFVELALDLEETLSCQSKPERQR